MSITALGGAEIVGRRASAYRTSFPIEELEVDIPGRGRARLVCKRLDRDGLDPTARLAKPLFLHAAEREPLVYEQLLPRGPAGPPLFQGVERDGEQVHLFIEQIDGRPLSEVGERALWEEAARWLGSFHATFAGTFDLVAEGRLLEHDADFHRFWLCRARSFVDSGSTGAAALEWLDGRHEQVVEALSAMDRTLLHGEFYAANVLVAEDRAPTRVAAVDWELAGPGPGALDLAALVCGWPEADREAMRRAYGVGYGRELAARELDLARLQVAVQWLGWAPPEWEPPPGQRRDWAGEAIEIAETLEL